MLSLLLLLGASSAAAFWRLPCDPLVVQRAGECRADLTSDDTLILCSIFFADPLTNPGTQSMHVHTSVDVAVSISARWLTAHLHDRIACVASSDAAVMRSHSRSFANRGGSNFNLEMSFDYAREGRCSR